MCNNISKKIFYKKGFTLVELLVVISIIGLLSTLAVIALDNARVKARNARRKSDVTQIVKALELYADAYSGVYPSTPPTGNPLYNDAKCLGLGTSQKCFNGRFTGLDSLKSSLLSYLGNMPVDPSRKSQNFDSYLYSSQCHPDHIYGVGSGATQGKPCVYWLPEGILDAAACEPGRIGNSGSTICGVNCYFCTLMTSN